jgi:ribosomal protein S6--L-glutamate ligase
MKIAILTSSPVENQKLVDTAIKRGHECRIIDPRKTYQFVSEYEQGFDRLYYGSDGNEPERITAKSLDCVINRIGSNTEYAAAVLRFMTENLGIYCPNNPWGIVYAANKSWTLQRLSHAGIKVPRTLISESPAHVKWVIEKIGSLPVIIKTNHGSKGKTVSIIDTKRSANSMFEFCVNTGLKVLIEEYIESDSSDYRVWVVGDKIAVTMKRTARDKDDFRANVSRGAKGEKVELSPEDEELCIKAAHCIGLNVAGVDLLKSKKTGTSYIIEINANPGTKVIDITGVNVFDSVIEYCEANYKKGNAAGITAAMTDSIILQDGNFLKTVSAAFNENTLLKEKVSRLETEIQSKKMNFKFPYK